MKRLHTEGTRAWHVFSRGVRRLALFYEDRDYLEFLAILRYALEKSGCRLWAYVLMSNHYHLILWGRQEQVTACLRRVDYLYSLYHNKRHGLTGHAFDGPYKAYPQKSDYLLLCRVAYVILNPVAAGMVRRPEDYRWSCAKEYLGVGSGPLAVDPRPVLQKLDPDEGKARAQFILILKAQSLRARKPSSNIPTAAEVNRQQFEWLLERAREKRGEFDGERATVVALHWGRECGVPPRAMAAALDNVTSHQVRDTLYRFSKRLEESPFLRKRISPP